MTRHLVVMAKAPRLGKVKTRLAKEIGLVKAWAFALTSLRDATRRLKDPRWTCWLAVTPDGGARDRRREGWRVIGQGAGDLGRRMLKPLRALPPGPVVIVGTDIPMMQKAHIWKAFRALGHHDWVFGPATDGGYWLVGAKRRPRLSDPFRNVRWSSAHALSDTLANFRHGARIAFIDTLSDVDDLAAYQNVQPLSSSACVRQARKPGSLST